MMRLLIKIAVKVGERMEAMIELPLIPTHIPVFFFLPLFHSPFVFCVSFCVRVSDISSALSSRKLIIIRICIKLMSARVAGRLMRRCSAKTRGPCRHNRIILQCA